MAEGIRSTLAQASAWLRADWVGRDRGFEGVSSDSRQIAPGSLFVAIRGERHDGHDHVLEAARRGAAAAMVARRVHVAIPQIIVPDTRIALAQLASAWRTVLGTPLVALTGSNGKTTTKEMIAAILGLAGPVLATRGNLNNDLGVPLTLLRLAPQHRFAVIEMGANHPGEIAYLTAIARPDVALLNNAGPAHLEGFGSVEGVARAKAEIFDGLREGGIAVVNGDSEFALMWRLRAAPHRVVAFGLEAEDADVSAAWEAQGEGSALHVRHARGEFDAKLALPGRHNVMNALAATAASLALGATPSMVQAGLAAMRPVHGRMEQRRGRGGALIIDDTYNANPASLRAGMEVLAAKRGRRLLALGDMGELGETGDALHAEAGRTARELGLDGLFATGELSRHAVTAFGAGAQHFPDQASLIAALQSELAPDVTVLVKGSRSRRMENVVAALAANEV
ncbi:MAG: UDP-N-acetylmuramoyl-tripeptide--D-alanyl-D-alanine ligase [Thiohalomonadaceae bacterium]